MASHSGTHTTILHNENAAGEAIAMPLENASAGSQRARYELRPEDLLNALMILQERIKAQGIKPRQ